MGGFTIRTETKRTAFISGPVLQGIMKAALGIPEGLGAWIRAEMSDDQSTVLSLEVEWLERGADLPLTHEGNSQ